jgi:hypothetical protein
MATTGELRMTMTFYNPEVTGAFIDLCKKNGLHGTLATTRVGAVRRDRVTVRGFKNRTAMATFTAAWATISLTPA